MLRRFWVPKSIPRFTTSTSHSLSNVTEEVLSGRKGAADINTKHNFAVQRFSKAPYDLKTRVVVVSHAEGFLATLEWRWNDPSRDGRTVVALTSGINSNRKLAISEACRAMLTKQKLIEKEDSVQTDAVKEVEECIAGGHYGHACRAIQNAVFNSGVKLDSVSQLFKELWRRVVSQHDARMAEMLISVLEKAGEVDPIFYESLIQELVFISKQEFSESVLLSLFSDRVSIKMPERGLISSEVAKKSDIEKWKYWRSLLAMEEVANIHSSLKAKEDLVSLRMTLESAAVPLIKLRGSKRIFLIPDSLVVLSVVNEPEICLTGKVTEVSTRPDGEVAVTVSLLTEEKNNLLFRESEIDLTVLAESRVTFDRIANCLREFYRVSPVADFAYRFSDPMRRLLLGQDIRGSFSPMLPPPDLSGEKHSMNLSDAQMQAVVHSLSHPLTLIHGPAGTGKTHTLTAIVSAWHKSNKDKKILCCADSNTAADNIFASLKKRGFQVFRFGSWKAVADVPEDVLSVLPNKALVEKYRSNARSGVNSQGLLVGLRKQIEEEALKHFKIVVSTLSSSRHASLDKVFFPSVIIDESAQTTEPAALLAVSHGCERLVLVGDHKQLPAVVFSKEAQKLGFSVSLFERLIQKETFPSVLLNIQRRMHPLIAEWPSKAFYENKLETHASLFQQEMHALQFFQKSSRVFLVDTDGVGGGEEQKGTSTRNVGESRVLSSVVTRLVDSGISPTQIGIIVPYLAQKAVLTKNFKIFKGLLVNTVEGFQGQERDFIVISTTRSNVVGSIGFLEDERRMNVMLTRAKQGLIVVGDKYTLKKKSNGKWAEWIAWCELRGAVIHHRSLDS